jgi:hypothetical protein
LKKKLSDPKYFVKNTMTFHLKNSDIKASNISNLKSCQKYNLIASIASFIKFTIILFGPFMFLIVMLYKILDWQNKNLNKIEGGGAERQGSEIFFL